MASDIPTSAVAPTRRPHARSIVPRLGFVAVALLVLPGAAFSGSACSGDPGGGGRACTEIGCEDGVTFTFGAGALAGAAAPVVLTACIDDQCTKEVVRRRDLRSWSQAMARAPAESLDPTVRHTASLTVVDGRGMTVFWTTRTVKLRTTRPNGPGCPPSCHQAQVAVDLTRA
jgi:hypothetical protein